MPRVAMAPPIKVVVRTPILSVNTPDTMDMKNVIPMVSDRHKAVEIRTTISNITYEE